MANKIKNALDWFYQRVVKEPTKENYDEFMAKDRELSDLIYKMWQNDLISDKVKDECYKVLQDYGWNAIKVMGKCN